jgi:hypothetical protein
MDALEGLMSITGTFFNGTICEGNVIHLKTAANAGPEM